MQLRPFGVLLGGVLVSNSGPLKNGLTKRGRPFYQELTQPEI